MTERAILIGRQHHMTGILCGPERGIPRAERPAVILLNAGLLHRIGPHRLYVDMARDLAALGFLTLRVDLCGIGDSPPRKDALTFADGAVADVRRAMDHLSRQHGVTSFILGGLCSGADNAFQTAVVDERVCGLILLDWYAYRTKLFYLRHYGPRIFRFQPWRNKLLRGLHRLGAQSGGPQRNDVDPYAREFPPREIVAAQLDAMFRRGTHGLFIYTAGQSMFYNHRSQFPRMFGGVEFRGRARWDFFAESDHTFTLLQNRHQLRGIVVDWIQDVEWGDGADQPARSLQADAL